MVLFSLCFCWWMILGQYKSFLYSRYLPAKIRKTSYTLLTLLESETSASQNQVHFKGAKTFAQKTEKSNWKSVSRMLEFQVLCLQRRYCSIVLMRLSKTTLQLDKTLQEEQVYTTPRYAQKCTCNSVATYRDSRGSVSSTDRQLVVRILTFDSCRRLYNSHRRTNHFETLERWYQCLADFGHACCWAFVDFACFLTSYLNSRSHLMTLAVGNMEYCWLHPSRNHWPAFGRTLPYLERELQSV